MSKWKKLSSLGGGVCIVPKILCDNISISPCVCVCAHADVYILYVYMNIHRHTLHYWHLYLYFGMPWIQGSAVQVLGYCNKNKWFSVFSPYFLPHIVLFLLLLLCFSFPHLVSSNTLTSFCKDSICMNDLFFEFLLGPGNRWHFLLQVFSRAAELVHIT